MPVKHVYSQTVADGTATSVVRPSDWNSNHNWTINLSGNTNNANSVSGTDIVLAGGSNVTLIGTGSTVSISGNPGPGQRGWLEVGEQRFTSLVGLSATNISNRPLFQPFYLAGTGLSVKTMRIALSGVSSSNRSFGGTFQIGVYQVNGTSATLLGSDSQSFSLSASSQGSVWNGFRFADFTGTGLNTVVLTAEGEYLVGMNFQPVSANATWASMQLWGADPVPGISGYFIGNTTSASGASSNMEPFYGAYSVTTAGMPNTVGSADVAGGNASVSAYEYYVMLKGLD